MLLETKGFKMLTFRELVEQTIKENDSSVEFFVKHGINPSVCNLPLYDADSNGLIIVYGPDKKNSEYFLDKDNKIVNDDTNEVIIANVIEKRHPNNNYSKEITDKRSITVSKLKEILSDEKNQETLIDRGIFDIDLDSNDQRKKALDKYNAEMQARKDKDNNQFEDWFNKNKEYFDIDNKALGKRLYALHLKGFSNDEIEKSYDFWVYNNKHVIDIIENNIKTNNNLTKEQKDNLLLDFHKETRNWYRDDMENMTYRNNDKSSISTLIKANNWWKNHKEIQKEATFFSNKPKTITDMHEIREILPELGIDPKFITVPITIKSRYNKQKYTSASEDPNAKPEEMVTIKSFPDANEIYQIIDIKKQLDKETDQNKINELLLKGDKLLKDVKVKVKGKYDTYEMNLDTLKKYIELPINKNAELNTTDYRLKAKQQFNTLNPGVGRYVDIPEEVVIEMLKTVQEEYEDDYPYGFDLVKHYLQNKDSAKDNITTEALNKYNGDNKSSIRRFYNKERNVYNYRGLVSYDPDVKLHPSIPRKNDFNSIVGD